MYVSVSLVYLFLAGGVCVCQHWPKYCAGFFICLIMRFYPSASIIITGHLSHETSSPSVKVKVQSPSNLMSSFILRRWTANMCVILAESNMKIIFFMWQKYCLIHWRQKICQKCWSQRLDICYLRYIFVVVCIYCRWIWGIVVMWRNERRPSKWIIDNDAGISVQDHLTDTHTHIYTDKRARIRTWKWKMKNKKLKINDGIFQYDRIAQ